ncbi:MAG TPA: hypothetical protein EYH31_06315, partial [Anaerolineae bacterium]|nr:hypothetical protein [Anaerolineae bacterium]
QHGIPVQRVQKRSFFEQPDVRELVRYLQLLRSLTDHDFQMALNFPRTVVDELTLIQLHRLAGEAKVLLTWLARHPEDFPQISPMTRVNVQRFLQLLDSDLVPQAGTPMQTLVQRLFSVVEQRRSPWREADRELLRGFMATVRFPQQVQVLVDALAAGQPVVLKAPNDVDGIAAATVIRHTLRTYFGIELNPISAEDSIDRGQISLFSSMVDDGSLAQEACWLLVGSEAEVNAPTTATSTVRLDGVDRGSIRYSLSLLAWRFCQELLLAHERLDQGAFVIYDLETTGTDLRRDEIVEMAAQRYKRRQPVGKPFYQLVRPAYHDFIPRAATAVHGIRWRDVADKPSLAEVLPDFLAYVGDMTMVGHNIERFDNRLLERAMGKSLGRTLAGHPFLDTLRLARRLLDLRQYDLEHVVSALGLKERVRHRAAADVEQTAAVFYALLDEERHRKEREALVEVLPLVAVGLLVADAPLVDENAAIVDGAARILRRLSAQPWLADLLSFLPQENRPSVQTWLSWLRERNPPPSAEDERWEALKTAFIAQIEDFVQVSPEDSLTAFLDYQALVTNVDTFEEESGRVTMMTLHNAKGTEFPVVIITGLEEGNLPLWQVQSDEVARREERRVLYVGMTRAKERLYLCSVLNRGDALLRGPTRFLFNIPGRYLVRVQVDPRGRVKTL